MEHFPLSILLYQMKLKVEWQYKFESGIEKISFVSYFVKSIQVVI